MQKQKRNTDSARDLSAARPAPQERTVRRERNQHAPGATSEQQRFAQQLHDSVSQNLSGMRILAELLARQLKTEAPEAEAKALELAELIQRTGEDVQALIRSLRGDHAGH